MQINFDDILFAAEYATENIIADLKQCDIQKAVKKYPSEPALKKLFEEIRKKYSPQNVFSNEFSTFILDYTVSVAIHKYHEQLRKKMLEKGIDIGEMNMESTELRDSYYQKLEEDADDDC